MRSIKKGDLIVFTDSKGNVNNSAVAIFDILPEGNVSFFKYVIDDKGQLKVKNLTATDYDKICRVYKK